MLIFRHVLFFFTITPLFLIEGKYIKVPADIRVEDEKGEDCDYDNFLWRVVYDDLDFDSYQVFFFMNLYYSFINFCVIKVTGNKANSN